MKKEIRCWVIFVYYCSKDGVKFFLISKDGIKFEPIYCKGKTCEQAREYLHKLINLCEKDFFPDRDVNWWKSLSVSKEDRVIYKIAASAARVKDKNKVMVPSKYKSSGWFNKEKAFGKIGHWKGYTRSFKKIFSGDTFWECVST